MNTRAHTHTHGSVQITLLPYTSKFSRRTIFADCSFQTFRGNNFRGSRVSSIEYSKFRELYFRGLLKSAKTAKIMCRENLDVYGMLFVDRVNRNWFGSLLRSQK